MITFIWQKEYTDMATLMADRLVEAGHDLTVYVRGGSSTPSAANSAEVAADRTSSAVALSKEVSRAKTMSQALEDAQSVITLLGSPQEVEDVYLGGGGIFEHAASASLFIDLSTSNPKLAKEIYALAAVHDHRFVEAPIDGEADYVSSGNYKLYAAGEPDNLAAAAELLRTLAPEVIEVGLPGSGVALKLSMQIALANMMMGLVEASAFAMISGVEKERLLQVLQGSAYTAGLAAAFGKRLLDEDFYYGIDLNRFYGDLCKALEAADDAGLALPGLETAHQLYDLMALVGGGQKGIHALALVYTDEERCAKHGLNWALAQKAMDVYERAGDEAYDDYYDEDDDCEDADCHHHHHDDEPPNIGRYFSPN